MNRYIDADKIEYEDMLYPRGDGNYEECQIAYRDQIDDIPTADVRENVNGEWITTYLDHVAMGERPKILYCSVCNQCIAYPTNFCPNCGADMRGDNP